MKKRVVITGAGICSPLGSDPDSFFNALAAGRSGIRRISAPFATALAMPYAGTIAEDVESAFPKLKRTGMDRVAMLALLAARQAVARSGAALGGAASERTGIYWSTGMGGAHALEHAYQELLVTKAARLRPSSIVMVMNNSATGHIGIDLAIRGPSYTYSSACSSSAVAIGEAFRAIRFGLVEQAIAGGAEALLTLGVIKAWESLGTLAHADARGAETACRPFAGDRSGFLLGEGACALMLEEHDMARARGAAIRGDVCTAATPPGDWPISAMATRGSTANVATPRMVGFRCSVTVAPRSAAVVAARLGSGAPGRPTPGRLTHQLGQIIKNRCNSAQMHYPS